MDHGTAATSTVWPSGPDVVLAWIYILVLFVLISALVHSIYRMTCNDSTFYRRSRGATSKSDQASLVFAEGRGGDLQQVDERGSGSRCGSDRSKKKNRRTSSTSVQSDFKRDPSREASREASSQESLNSAASSRRAPSQQMMRSGSPLPRSDADGVCNILLNSQCVFLPFVKSLQNNFKLVISFFLLRVFSFVFFLIVQIKNLHCLKFHF